MKRLLVLADGLVVPLLGIWLALTLAPILIGPQPAAASSPQVGGLMSSDTTWTAANSPYVVTSNILVDTGVTLTIEPGVTVRFESGKYLWVKGTLLAVGTATNRIRFTSNRDDPAPWDWDGIAFTEESGATSRLEYSIIEYGGQGNSITMFGGGIYVRCSSPTISHNVIVNNAAAGILVDSCNGGLAPVISHNLIKNNTVPSMPPPPGSATIPQGLDFTPNNPTRSSMVKPQASVGGRGIMLSGSGFIGRIEYNTVISNSVGLGISYSGEMSATLSYNNLYSNSSYDVEMTAVTANQSLPNNFWGSTDAGSINSHIYDFYDDFTLGKVLYSPIQATPLITAPLAPPTGVVTSVIGSNVSLSWAANVESDLTGYNVYRRRSGETTYQKLTASITTSTAYQDTPPTYSTFYYAITAVDTSAEESWYSDPVIATVQAPTPTPTRTPLAVYLPIVIRTSSGW